MVPGADGGSGALSGFGLKGGTVGDGWRTTISTGGGRLILREEAWTIKIRGFHFGSQKNREISIVFEDYREFQSFF